MNILFVPVMPVVLWQKELRALAADNIGCNDCISWPICRLWSKAD